MAWPVSENWQRIAGRSGAALLWRVTAQAPGRDPIELRTTSLSVKKSLGTQMAFSADLTVVPIDGQRCFETVTTPGAVFAVDAGFEYGGGASEMIPMGRYVLSKNSWPFRSAISLSLADKWQALEQARFSVPYSPGAQDRTDLVALMIQQALPAQTFVNEVVAKGGSYTGGATWERSRTEAIQQVARDGEFEAAYRADGEFRMRPLPVIQPNAPAGTFTDGGGEGINANIISFDREIPFDRLYNRVVVVPQDDTQTWAAQQATVSDTWHGRHPMQLGELVGGGPLYVPYFYSSPTITSATQARSVARVLLAQVVNTTKSTSVQAVNCGHIEPGNTITTVVDGVGASWLVEEVGYEPMTGATTITGRDTTVPAMTEEAA